MMTGIVYKDDRYYSAFPSVARLKDNTLVVCFRRAPQRKPYSTHLDSESKAVMVYSKDNGAAWSEPSVVYEESGDVGVQDPSIARLKDGTLIANFFCWQVVKKDPFNHYVKSIGVVRSFNNGKTWEKKPHYVWETSSTRRAADHMATSEPVLELPDRKLLIPLYDNKGSSLIMSSDDKGETWKNKVEMAGDKYANIKMQEPTLCYTSSGKILCMMRENQAGYIFQTQSEDGGKSWSTAVKTNIWGYPANLLVLRDGRILCAYGHRRPPYGVRACISEDEGRTWDIKKEIIIRNDGFHGDVGYPSSTQLEDGSICTVYYFHTGKAGENNRIGHYAMPEGVRFIGQAVYQV